MVFFASHPIPSQRHALTGTLPARAVAAAVLQRPETLHRPEPSATAGEKRGEW